MKKEIRKEIDIIDEEIFKLFEKRMNLVKIIAGRKLKNNENIENKIREEEILKKISKIKDVSFYLKEWYIKLFELTKDYQNTIKSRENHGLYGLVGKGLKHTYSENVYKFLDIENYKIIDLNETEFENFIEKKVLLE